MGMVERAVLGGGAEGVVSEIGTMCMSRETVARRIEQARRYEREHRAERSAYQRAWRKTPIGRLKNHLYVTRFQHARKPSDRLADTIVRLTAEIERLGGKA